MSDDERKPLTPRQRAFVVEYLRDKNATKAAIRAGYSAHSAHVDGPRLLENAEVSREVAARLERMLLRVESKAEDVIRDLVELSQVDIGDAYDDMGRLLPIEEMPAALRKAIVSLETEEIYGYAPGEDGKSEKVPIGQVRKVKWVDPLKVKELLARYHKLLVDRVEHSADSSFADMLKKARERVGGR